MLSKGPAKKVTIFINETAKYHSQSLHDAILVYLMHRGIAGATATRAFAGFGSHQQMHTPKIEVLACDLPIRIEFVDVAEKVDEVLPTLYEMVADGLIEVQDTTVVRHARKAHRAEAKRPHERKQGPAKMLRAFLGEADRWNGEPLYDAIVKKLRMMEIAGATVYRGILGYGAKGHEHKRSFFHPMRDLPVMVTVIDSAEKIAAAAEAIEGMLEDGLIVVSDVEMVRLTRSPQTMEAPGEPAETPAKLLRIHISEADRFGGTSLYEAIVAKCRELGIAGATVFRGLEGYGETAELHKAHVTRHDQPLTIAIVDSAEKLATLVPHVEGMIHTGLLAISDVRVMRVQKGPASPE